MDPDQATTAAAAATPPAQSREHAMREWAAQKAAAASAAKDVARAARAEQAPAPAEAPAPAPVAAAPPPAAAPAEAPAVPDPAAAAPPKRSGYKRLKSELETLKSTGKELAEHATHFVHRNAELNDELAAERARAAALAARLKSEGIDPDEPGLREPEERAKLRKLERELANFRAAQEAQAQQSVAAQAARARANAEQAAQAIVAAASKHGCDPKEVAALYVAQGGKVPAEVVAQRLKPATARAAAEGMVPKVATPPGSKPVVGATPAPAPSYARGREGMLQWERDRVAKQQAARKGF